MDKVEEYMERWHEHQRELKEGGATWCLACLEYGHLPDVCPFEDPHFVQAFNRGEVETAEEWIHLKAILSPQVDQETCLTCVKGEGWCFAIGMVGHKAPNQPPPRQEVELLVLKKGRRSGAKKARKQAPAPRGGEPVQPAPRKGEPVHPAAMKVAPERQDPKRGKLRGGRWDGYLCLVEASKEEEGRPKGSCEAYLSALEAVNWCTACGKWGHFAVNCPILQEEEEKETHRFPATEGDYTLSPPPPLPPAGVEQRDLPLPPPPPPAEGECLLVLPQPPWEDCLPLPPPPAEAIWQFLYYRHLTGLDGSRTSPQFYTPHSFRIGTATSAARAKNNQPLIRNMGLLDLISS
ncbi:UNVERIFIED_CONTAM: hypothetical protein FKN15_059189 [Acipenser sinensis]